MGMGETEAWEVKLVNDSFSSHCSILSPQQEAVICLDAVGGRQALQYWE